MIDLFLFTDACALKAVICIFLTVRTHLFTHRYLKDDRCNPIKTRIT